METINGNSELFSRLEKTMLDFFIEAYLDKRAMQSSNDIKTHVQKEFTAEEIQQLGPHFQTLAKEYRIEDLGNKKKAYLLNSFVPYCRSIKQLIPNERLEKFQAELADIKEVYHAEIQKLGADRYEELEKSAEKEEEKKWQKQFIDSHLESTELIFEYSLLEKTKDEAFLRKIKKIATAFDDIHDQYKAELLEHEIALASITIKSIIFTASIIANLPTRRPEQQKINEIMSILLVE